MVDVERDQRVDDAVDHLGDGHGRERGVEHDIVRLVEQLDVASGQRLGDGFFVGEVLVERSR